MSKVSRQQRSFLPTTHCPGHFQAAHPLRAEPWQRLPSSVHLPSSVSPVLEISRSHDAVPDSRNSPSAMYPEAMSFAAPPTEPRRYREHPARFRVGSTRGRVKVRDEAMELSQRTKTTSASGGGGGSVGDRDRPSQKGPLTTMESLNPDE